MHTPQHSCLALGTLVAPHPRPTKSKVRRGKPHHFRSTWILFFGSEAGKNRCNLASLSLDMQVRNMITFLELSSPLVWGFKRSLATLLATKNPLWKKIGDGKKMTPIDCTCALTQLGSRAVTSDFAHLTRPGVGHQLCLWIGSWFPIQQDKASGIL